MNFCNEVHTGMPLPGEEQERTYYDDDDWCALDDALKIIGEQVEGIKDAVRKCIDTHFSPKEQDWISSQIVPVYTNPNAGTNRDDDAIYVLFEVYDVDGLVAVQLAIHAQGCFTLKYRPDGSASLKEDDVPIEYRFDEKPGRPNTVVKFALFTTAMTYMLLFGYDDFVLDMLNMCPREYEEVYDESDCDF